MSYNELITHLQADLDRANARCDALRKNCNDEFHRAWQAGIELNALRKAFTEEATTLRAELVSLRDANAATCLWREGADGGEWDTACGLSWIFIDGGPEDNNVTFCPNCGKRALFAYHLEAKDEEEE
jgi:hypothetical protein